MKTAISFIAITLIMSVSVAAHAQDNGPAVPLKARDGFDMATVEKGRYLIKISGCNDCHTQGYLQGGGAVPVEEWLTGDRFGWRGPWGTTYGANLRLFMAARSEADWVHFAKTMKARPTMPWFSVNAMSEGDLAAIYQFVRYLGPAGLPAPDYLPPGVEPMGPYALFP